MQFESFYWKGAEIPPVYRPLVEELEDQRPSVDQRKAALVRMLASDSEVVRGIALDFYCLSNADLRHGPVPMIDDTVEDAVREAALRELERPPYERAEADARPRRGANHASALAALANNASAADAPLLARVLQENDHELVLLEGVRAAESVLHGEPAHPELVNVLLGMARRIDLDPSIRAHAIAAIGFTVGDAAVPWLVEALEASDLTVSAAGARSLLERDFKRYRPMVAPVASAWHTGEFPPFDVQEVRRLLDERFIEAAGVKITLTDTGAGLELDPIRPFEALAWVANNWSNGEFPDLLDLVERAEDAIGPRSSVTRALAGEITDARRALWREATGTDIGDDPVVVRSEMTPRNLLLPRRALIALLQAFAHARAEAH
ncbi:MAG TPA: hypothetical protein VHN14_29705 [Kofleriaceae bacterium]|nr:hypothetical protein [Kofleriaceae bacterium]